MESASLAIQRDGVYGEVAHDIARDITAEGEANGKASDGVARRQSNGISAAVGPCGIAGCAKQRKAAHHQSDTAAIKLLVVFQSLVEVVVASAFAHVNDVVCRIHIAGAT